MVSIIFPFFLLALSLVGAQPWMGWGWPPYMYNSDMYPFLTFNGNNVGNTNGNTNGNNGASTRDPRCQGEVMCTPSNQAYCPNAACAGQTICCPYTRRVGLWGYQEVPGFSCCVVPRTTNTQTGTGTNPLPGGGTNPLPGGGNPQTGPGNPTGNNNNNNNTTG